ncbi:MAG: enterochelin esterase [Phycisphaerales bacterium]|nr:enterochelin esterase [Phycisphaerae bacterium]NNF43899.1 enterochelin esterase [Phycisphaerales bacterium]NNM25599.1 enterochelin esterase [Phycisphaerales bacterium]
MISATRQLRRDLETDPTIVDRLAAAKRIPLTDGTTTTFLYRGEADEVLLRHFIYGLPTTQRFERIGGTDVWSCVMELPERSRVEYKIQVTRNGQSQLIRDPLNPRLARDPYGANSVCHGPGYETPAWTIADEEARPGTLAPLTLERTVFGEPRHVTVYEPPRFRPTRRYPLLIVHDGEEFVEYANLKVVLDNLIYRLEIPPMIVALTQSPRRLDEYAASEQHARFIGDDLLPRLESEYPLLPDPSARGLMGASFGAVAAFSAACHEPEAFGRLLLLSGSFAFSDIGDDHGRSPAFDPVARFVNAFRDTPRRVTDRVFLACGTYESLIYENRSLLPLLQSAGMEVRYREARDGHNWMNWRDRLREGLAWLFPGPLWLVYE